MRHAREHRRARRAGRALAWAAALGAALAAPSAPAAESGAARRLVVATRDAELVSALSVAFAPRGVEVTTAPRPLRSPSDPLLDADAHAVWLCEPVEGGTALCVRPRGAPVIVRPIAMAAPLSAEEAAALALSVEATLLGGRDAPPVAAAAPPPVVLARAAPTAPAAAASALRPLSLELAGGGRFEGAGVRARAGAAVAFTPGTDRFRVGAGGGVEIGPAVTVPPATSGPGPSMPGAHDRDLTLRAFARGALRLGPTWLQAEVGPAAHVVTRQVDDPHSGSVGDDTRDGWSADGALGVIVPIGRCFAGARAGASYRLDPRPRDDPGGHTPWSAEARAVLGVGIF
jgi:hypothetical protein